MLLVRLRRLVLPLTILLAVLVASPALADSSAPADLGISPLGYDGSWFDLELEPGEQVDLEIELANHGQQSVAARSYVADVYSLINGGMGVGLYDETADNPVTGWIDYPSSTPMLGPDSALRRPVSVAVPEDAVPGQYIAALVIEHEADRADNADDLGIDQVVRQAVAVNITVPGTTAPQLELGDTGHLLTAERSTLRTELDNLGNWHLVPSGDLELVGPDGQSITEQDFELAIVYADTRTHVETILDHQLDPGIYTITTNLIDANHDVRTTHTNTFEVEAPPLDATLPVDRILETLDSSGLGLLGAALLVVVLLTTLLVVLARRRRSRRANVLPAPPAPAFAPRPTEPPPSKVPAFTRVQPTPPPAAVPRPDSPPPQRPTSPRAAPAGIDMALFTAHGAPPARRWRR